MTETENKPRTKTRGAGEGSVFQRGDGKWTATITVGYSETGKRLRKTVYGETKREVTEKLTRLQGQKLDGTLLATSRLTVADFLQRWLDAIKCSVRPTTHASYDNNVRLHINPRIGGIRLLTLSPAQVQSVYGKMAEAGLSPRMQQLIHTILRRALAQGMKWGLLARNVCDAVERPRVPKFEFRALTPEEVGKLLEAAKGRRLEAIFTLAVATGLRVGELLGLQWDDIDLDAGLLSVRRTMNELHGKPFFNEPKTSKSRRQVILPRIAVDALHDHRKRMLAEGNAAGPLVFCAQHGGPVLRWTLRHRYWLPVLKKAKLPEQTRFHDLRHTAATLLLTEGTHPKVVQEMLGHSTITLTLDTYSHVVPTMQADAAGKMDRLLRKHG
jgi:integrase